MNNKPHIRNVIAGNVKKYRKLRQLTQENLAELADVSNTYIANIECGQTWISDKTLEKIAAALHIEGRTLDVIIMFRYLDQFIHFQSLLSPIRIKNDIVSRAAI